MPRRLVSSLSEQEKPQEQHSYSPITDEELADIVTQQGQPHFWSEQKRPRFSLAGAQNNFPVLVREKQYLLPLGEFPSTHILKFEVMGYRNVPAYETHATLLAKACGLPVVNIELRAINDVYFTIVERYDRLYGDDGEVVRRHQEDFCQALGYGHERKYQVDRGPSFGECFGMLREVSTDPATDIEHLLRWQIFNVLAGNSDGHAKNLSLLYKINGEIRLAPFYDLVCTRAIERIDPSLTMSVGNERNPGVIVKHDWEDMARQCDIRPRYLLDLVNELVILLPENLASARAFFENKFGEYPALQRIEQVVNNQCRRAMRN